MKPIEELLAELKEAEERKGKAEEDIYSLQEAIESAGYHVATRSKIETAMRTGPLCVNSYSSRLGRSEEPYVVLHCPNPFSIPSFYAYDEGKIQIRAIEKQVSISGHLCDLLPFLKEKKLVANWEFLPR
jgi:hypothetical protein